MILLLMNHKNLKIILKSEECKMYNNTNKGSKETKISGVVDKLKNIIRKNKDLGIPEDQLLRQHVNNCFVLSYLREDGIDFKNSEDVDQVVKDIKVKIAEEVIR